MYMLYRELGRAHYQDLLRAARQERAAREAQAAPARTSRAAWQARALAWCGEQLVDWGERLQTAAGVESAEPPCLPEGCAESVA